MPKSPPPPKARAAPRGIVGTFAHRPRLLAGAILMVVAYLAFRFDIREATRLLVAWNVGAWAFLGMIAAMVADPKRDARVQARPEDENQWVLGAPGDCGGLCGHSSDRLGARPGEGYDGLVEGGAFGARRRDGLKRLDLPPGDVCVALCGRLFRARAGRVSWRPRVPRDGPARLDGILLSGLRARLHVRELRTSMSRRSGCDASASFRASSGSSSTRSSSPSPSTSRPISSSAASPDMEPQ